VRIIAVIRRKKNCSYYERKGTIATMRGREGERMAAANMYYIL